jgi:hypothetical protein
MTDTSRGKQSRQQPTRPRFLIPLIRLAILVGAVAAPVPSCGLIFPLNQPAPKSSSDQPSSVVVEVQSRNWSDITVYLMAGGLPQRLGMVTALGTASFDFPSQRIDNGGGVRLRALPVAGQPFTSENILVVPGQVISWTLENNLDRSSFSVY